MGAFLTTVIEFSHADDNDIAANLRGYLAREGEYLTCDDLGQGYDPWGDDCKFTDQLVRTFGESQRHTAKYSGSNVAGIGPRFNACRGRRFATRLWSMRLRPFRSSRAPRAGSA
jgi:hypothetical protein